MTSAGDDDDSNRSKNQIATINIKNCINLKRTTSAIVDDVVLLYGFWAVVVDADLFPARKAVVIPLLFNDDDASSSIRIALVVELDGCDDCVFVVRRWISMILLMLLEHQPQEATASFGYSTHSFTFAEKKRETPLPPHSFSVHQRRDGLEYHHTLFFDYIHHHDVAAPGRRVHQL